MLAKIGKILTHEQISRVSDYIALVEIFIAIYESLAKDVETIKRAVANLGIRDEIIAKEV